MPSWKESKVWLEGEWHVFDLLHNCNLQTILFEQKPVPDSDSLNMDYLLEKFPKDILLGHLLYFCHRWVCISSISVFLYVLSWPSLSPPLETAAVAPGTVPAFSWLQSPSLTVKHPLCGPHFCLSLRALTMVGRFAHRWATPSIPFGSFSVPP